MEKVSRTLYLVAAWLFVAGVLVQVFLAGMVVVAGQMGWNNHKDLGHTMALPLLVMLATMYLGRLPGSMKRLTWLLIVLYILQVDVVIFLREPAPVVSALHPVLALIDFALGLSLALQAQKLARSSTVPDGIIAPLESTATD